MIGDTVPVINHGEQARSRVATQYLESYRFLEFIQALMLQSDELEKVFQDIAKQTDIDIAEGVNLDVIGIIVPNAIPIPFYVFDDTAAAKGFGEEGQLGFGARFRDETEPFAATSVLADPEYRLLIRAKIIKNHARGTNEDIIKGLTYLFGADNGTMVEDLGGMTISLVFPRQLTTVEIAILDELDILPRPAGVQIKRRLFRDPLDFFGFEEQPGAQGLGEEGDAITGGTLAEEF
jgi:hypothetical protein